MDFVKREDQNVIDEDNYKMYWETIQKTQQTEVNDYQHTPISMEQLHQAMQSSLNAGTIMHNFQLPLSPRQMSTLMLKTNHLSRNLNFNDIPAHLQRNLELDIVHNLTNELPTLRHEELLMSRGIDLNLARMNDLELQNSSVLTQTLVQNLNENLALGDVNLPQNLRAELPHDLNHELDLSHHLNRNIEQEILNHDRRTPLQLQDGLLEQNLGQRLEALPPRLDQLGRLDQRLVQNINLHENQSEHLLPMPFHIKSEQEDDGYFYENINQLPSVNTMNGHISDGSQNQNVPQDQMYVYSNHVSNIPALNTIDLYSRPQNYPQNYTPPIRDNPQNLVVHRQFENHSPYEEIKKDVCLDNKIENQKLEEPKENLKPNENKIYYQEYQTFDNVKSQKEDPALISKEFDIRGEYICFKCSVIFPSKRLLKQHSKACDKDSDDGGEKLGKFSCSQCSYRCQAPATLKIHERIHSGVKPYSCNFCSYKSGQKNNVAKHILVHMKQKPFRCQYCDYRCAQKNNLVVHERTHTGYKPFACSFCDYRTVQKPNLVKHMYLHTDQKPFSCDMCNYRCVQKTNLTKHKQRHLNEKDGDAVDVKNQVKPYRPRQKTVKCPHCAYRCVQKASLEKHIMFKHNEFAEQTLKSNEFAEQMVKGNEFAEQTLKSNEFAEEEFDEGVNLMKVSDVGEEPAQNLSVKKSPQMFESIQEIKDSLQVHS